MTDVGLTCMRQAHEGREVQLRSGGLDQIPSAQDVRDGVVRVLHDGRQLICRKVIATPDDEVPECRGEIDLLTVDADDRAGLDGKTKRRLVGYEVTIPVPASGRAASGGNTLQFPTAA